MDSPAPFPPPSSEPQKDDRRAWLISLFVPGAGQIYCGKKTRGYWTLGFFLLAFLVVILLPAQTPLFGAALRAALVLYGYSFLDAYFTARELNQGRTRLLIRTRAPQPC